MNYIDEALIELRAGNGGSGCLSFRREKYIPRGGPDGGDGGRGGNIVFQVDASINTLIDFHHKKVIQAQNGRPGAGKNRTGADGTDLILKVPAGTIVLDQATNNLIQDCSEPDMQYILAKGGEGGLGNTRFKSSTNQAPRKITKGEDGEQLFIKLELQSLADVGLVGFPNAGKSTFLSSVSAARPKIGDYPFTTLRPNLGTVKMGYGTMVIADIPGIIEGASDGLGLGLRFLKHISRTKSLLFLLDPINPEMTLIQQFESLMGELKKYDSTLLEKNLFVAINKSDVISEPDVLMKEFTKRVKPISLKGLHLISAITTEGVKELLEKVYSSFN
jgi:GTP-binding protein